MGKFSQEENETFVLYRQGEGRILTSLGELAQQRGRLREAEGYYKQSLGILRETGSRESQVMTLSIWVKLPNIVSKKERQSSILETHCLLLVRQTIIKGRSESIVLVHMADLAFSLNQTRAAR